MHLLGINITLITGYSFMLPWQYPGADPGFDQGGGGPDRDRPKTAILGPQFCRILVLGPQFWWSGGAPWIRPWYLCMFAKLPNQLCT